MSATLLDSPLHAGLFGDPATSAIFSDEAQIGAMLRVEGALAQAQGALGLIPPEAATAIAEAARVALIPASELAEAVAADGVPVPALVAAFRVRLLPQHAQWVHWGPTSQDVVDTALSLRLKDMLRAWEPRFGDLLRHLARHARAHAETPMAARTYGQIAVPTSFGAVAASWGRPALALRERLAGVARTELQVSLGGAAGTLSAMGPKGPEVRAALADILGLADPGASWHAQRHQVAALAALLAELLGSLGKMGEDLLLLAQSGVGEVRVEGAGGSSTMPQKENPVGPSVLVALARTGLGIAGILQGAALHRQQRDGAAWFTEWLTLPYLCCLAGRALTLAGDLAGRLQPDREAMRRNMEAGGGLVHAEALSFALAALMPRPEAQAAIKALVREADGRSLPDLARERHAGLDWTGPDLGQAPSEARAFAQAVGEPAGA